MLETTEDVSITEDDTMLVLGMTEEDTIDVSEAIEETEVAMLLLEGTED